MRLLRNHGIMVSLSQVLAALSAVAVAGFDREDFYAALESVLVCERVDRPLFKRLFVAYFSPPDAGNRPEEKGGGEIDESDEDIDVAEEKSYAAVDYLKGFSEQKSEQEKLEELLHVPPAILLAKAAAENDYRLLHYLAELGVRSLGRLKREDVYRLEELVEKAQKAIGWFDVVQSLMPNF